MNSVVEIINRVFSQSELPENYQELFLYTCEKKIDIDYMYISTGDIFEFRNKCLTLYRDLKDIKLNKQSRLLCCLFFHIISRFVKYDPSIYKIMMEEVFLNDNNRQAILNAPSSESGFVNFVKFLAPKYNELMALLQENKSYAALKKYREIIDILNRHGIPEELSKEEIQDVLKRRYQSSSSKSSFNEYLKQTREFVFKPEGTFEVENFVYAQNYCDEAVALQRILHQKMLEHYKKSNCFFRQLNADVNLYYLGDILIAAYKYDDIPGIALKKDDHVTYTWSDLEFWAKMFDPDIKFATHPKVNYYIDSDEGTEQYSLVHNELPGMQTVNHPKIIICPEEHIDEALYRVLTENGAVAPDHIKMSKLKALGFKYSDIKKKLLTGDGQFYFKDPTLVDELNIKKPENYKTLGQIKAKTNATSRKRCIAQIRYHAKNKPKQQEVPAYAQRRAYRRNESNSNRYWWKD